MIIVKNKFIFIGLAIAMVAGSIYSISHFGFKKGIDFTGGTIIEARALNGTTTVPINVSAFTNPELKAFALPEGGAKFISTLSYEEMSPIVKAFVGSYGTYTETQVNAVGPSLGAEMTKKALIAISVVVITILMFIAFSFRKVSLPVASWKYGVSAMVTLLHDIIVPAGVYAYLTFKYGAEVDTLFVIALLTVMAVSISDKIVVFDRIRENLRTGGKGNFESVVGQALKQTFTRSINTTLTTVLSLLALIAYGPESTKFFAITLLVGLIVGTYSSIFVASPLLVVWNKFARKGK